MVRRLEQGRDHHKVEYHRPGERVTSRSDHFISYVQRFISVITISYRAKVQPAGRDYWW